MINWLYQISLVLFFLSFFILLFIIGIKVLRWAILKFRKIPLSKIQEDINQDKDLLNPSHSDLKTALEDLETPKIFTDLFKDLWNKNLEFIKKAQISKSLMIIKNKEKYHIQQYHQFNIDELLDIENQIRLHLQVNNSIPLKNLFEGKSLYIKGDLKETILKLVFPKYLLNETQELFLISYPKKNESILFFHFLKGIKEEIQYEKLLKELYEQMQF